jgi:hypothetical protein
MIFGQVAYFGTYIPIGPYIVCCCSYHRLREEWLFDLQLSLLPTGSAALAMAGLDNGIQ